MVLGCFRSFHVLVTKHLWYDFELQAAGKSVGRVISFNSSFHTHMQHYEQSKTPVLLKNVIVHLVQVIGWLTTNQQHICVQILMSPLSAKLHPNLSQQPQSGQLQTLLLNSSWPLQQTRKMMFLGHCPLGTKNQIKLWSQLLTLKKTVYWRKALE